MPPRRRPYPTTPRAASSELPPDRPQTTSQAHREFLVGPFSVHRPFVQQQLALPEPAPNHHTRHPDKSAPPSPVDPHAPNSRPSIASMYVTRNFRFDASSP